MASSQATHVDGSSQIYNSSPNTSAQSGDPSGTPTPNGGPNGGLNVHQLPVTLRRPPGLEIREANLYKLEPSLEDAPVSYIQDFFGSDSPRWLKCANRLKLKPTSSGSTKPPNEVAYAVDGDLRCIPTHAIVVAIPGRDQTVSFEFFPSHSIIFALYCASIPISIYTETRSPAVLDEDQLTLPVLPLSLPHPATFAILHRYLYTKELEDVLKSLIPVRRNQRFYPSRVSFRESLVKYITPKFPPSLIMSILGRTHGLWSNMCYLGIADNALWEMVNTLWSVVLRGHHRMSGAASSAPRR